MNKNSDHPDFEDLYHSAPVGLLTYIQGRRIISANRFISELFDLDEENIRNRSFTDFLNNGGKLYYNLFIVPILQLSNEVKEISLEIAIGGKSIPCLFSARTEATEGEGLMVHATIFHVADRRKYEQELLIRKKRAEEERLKKDQALDEVAFTQSHLVRAPLANVIALTRLLAACPLAEDERSIVALLEQSASELDEVIKRIVNTARAEG